LTLLGIKTQWGDFFWRIRNIAATKAKDLIKGRKANAENFNNNLINQRYLLNMGDLGTSEKC